MVNFVTLMGDYVTFMVKKVTDMGENVTTVGFPHNVVDTELKKHAATIHCSNTLSLLQRKVSNALLYHAYAELMHQEEHEISVKQLCRLIGYQGNNHAAIREALKELISTVIEWNLINDVTGTENWTASSILASVSLEGPLCYYAYSPRMKQLLHSPTMFGKIDLIIQSRFRSSYGLALYENCIRYRGLPHTKWFDMPTFKKLMGVPQGMYEIFRDFKRRVLDKAINEVNTYSDLLITADFIREKRQIVKVRFLLKERAKRLRLGAKTSARAQKKQSIVLNDALKNRLMAEFDMSEKQIQTIFENYDSKLIEEKIELINASQSYQKGKIKNKSAYLLSAIKHDYKTVPVNRQSIIKRKQQNQEEQWLHIKQMVEQLRKKYQSYKEEKVEEALGQLDKEAYQQFMDAFSVYAEPVIQTILSVQSRRYNRENIVGSPQIKALLRQFSLMKLSHIQLLSFEDFSLKQEKPLRQAWKKLKAHDPDHTLLVLK